MKDPVSNTYSDPHPSPIERRDVSPARRHLFLLLRQGGDQGDPRHDHLGRRSHRPQVRQQPRAVRRPVPGGGAGLLRPQDHSGERVVEVQADAELQVLRRQPSHRADS